MRVAGLFAGIGGLELGLSRAGHRPVLLCENDPAAAAVLAARFPGVRRREDVRDLQTLPRGVDLLTAGFPCQDLSQAGRTRGIRGLRSSLVGEVFRLLARNPVPWVLLENVPFMLHLDRGRAMDLIVSELRSLGYRWAYRVVDTMAFGLPQRRRRVYLLASLRGEPADVLLAEDAEPPVENEWTGAEAVGFYWTEGNRGVGWAVDAVPTLKAGSGVGIPSPPAVLLPSGRVVRPSLRDAERLQGFPAGWTSPAEEGARWRLVGNAVTVRVAEWIGRRLLQPRRFPATRLSRPVRHGAWPSAACDMGPGPMRVDVGEWPVRRSRRGLAEFLRWSREPLSARATEGFVSRAERAEVTGSLRFEHGFLEALRAHLDSMRRGAASGRTGVATGARLSCDAGS